MRTPPIPVRYLARPRIRPLPEACLRFGSPRSTSAALAQVASTPAEWTQNTFTGRLTPQMLDDVFAQARERARDERR